MATAPANNALPLFYNQLEPLSSQAHADWRTRPMESAPYLATAHAIPLTVEEFPAAQRHYPVVFSVGASPVPLALMGLNEGVNVFMGEDGKLVENVYVPAYVRRYPFMLARLRPDAQELSLCFDPTAGFIGQFEDGDRLFDDAAEPSETTKAILGFCEQFETAGQKTQAFIKDLQDMKLLIDGEVAIQPDGVAQPFVYRGFQMVSEEKLRELRGDQARKLVQSGAMAMIYAHLMSLPLVREIFGRQMALDKVPGAVGNRQAPATETEKNG